MELGLWNVTVLTRMRGLAYTSATQLMDIGIYNATFDSTNGSIDFVHGSRMFLNKSILNHKPKVGDLLFFPNYLMHTVYPFSSEGERRSFSFNVEIDRGIANIFSK
jgi:hypothetical protein